MIDVDIMIQVYKKEIERLMEENTLLKITKQRKTSVKIIKQEDLLKKVFIISIVAIIVLIGEYFYFKNIQNSIKLLA